MEGVDGTGKSTNALRLAKEFNMTHFREPGSVPCAEAIREIILTQKMSQATQALLFIAARTEFVIEKLLPALNSGQNVIMERYFYSTMVYQDQALAHEVMSKLHNWMPLPDAVLLLECPPSISMARDINPGDQTIAGKDAEFFDRLKSKYRNVVKDVPHHLVDTSESKEAVYQKIRAIVGHCLKKN